MGSVYRRGKLWWIKYYASGIPIRESSRSSIKDDAKKLLSIREASLARGASILYSAHTPFSELIDDLLQDYLNNDRKTTNEIAGKLKLHVLPELGMLPAGSLSPAVIERYKTKRRKSGAKNATINRELSWIRKALNLGMESGKIQNRPKIKMLKESPARGGFFELKELSDLMEHLPLYLRPPVIFAYVTGWRKNEVLNLQWQYVHFDRDEIRIPPGRSKTDQPRVFPMIPELRAMLESQKTDIKKSDNPLCPWVFHRNGQQIKSVREAWDTATEKAGLEGKLFHDLRRTAARNLTQDGIPVGVAMRLMGHKTRAIFDRYSIVSEDDLKVAGKLLKSRRTGTNWAQFLNVQKSKKKISRR
jgi:integrase